MMRFQPCRSSGGGVLGGLAVDPVALDGDSGEDQGPQVRLPPPVEEVVGGRGHHRLVPNLRGQ